MTCGEGDCGARGVLPGASSGPAPDRGTREPAVDVGDGGPRRPGGSGPRK